jgi:hypothetical protein
MVTLARRLAALRRPLSSLQVFAACLCTEQLGDQCSTTIRLVLLAGDVVLVAVKVPVLSVEQVVAKEVRDGIAATAPRKNGTAGAGGGGEPPYRRPVSRGVPDVQSGPDRPSARYVSLSSRSCRPSSRALSSSGVSRSSGGCSCLRRRSHAETRANMPLMLLPAAAKGRGPGGGRTPSASSNPPYEPKRPQAASPDALSAMSSTIRTVGWSASST